MSGHGISRIEACSGSFHFFGGVNAALLLFGTEPCFFHSFLTNAVEEDAGWFCAVNGFLGFIVHAAQVGVAT